MVYWDRYDHFVDQRMIWRASTTRHLFHILPGQKILEIGAGDGKFTRELIKATRAECPVTAVIFNEDYRQRFAENVRSRSAGSCLLKDFPGELAHERFDYVVAHQMLNNDVRDLFLEEVKKLMNPDGGLLLFEQNPWNPYYRARCFIQRSLPFKWKRPAETVTLDLLKIYSVFSEIGYTQIHALPYDFLYSPIPKFLLWPAQHLSLIMENCPFIKNFAGSLFIWARHPSADDHPSPVRDLAEHEMFKKKVSFVIPCRNEEMNIVPLISGLRDFYNAYIQEIIIVDDNSADKTAEAALKMSAGDPRVRLVKRSGSNGVGRALRDGLKNAQGEYIVLMDCDFLAIIPEMRDLFDAVKNGADVAVGSRFSRGSVLLNYPFTKIIANRAFHCLANILLGKHFRDLTNNLKILKREAAEKITIEFNDFAANAETGIKPLLMGFKVTEVPISWMNRSANMGLSSFKILKTGPNYFWLLCRLVGKRICGKI